MIMDSKGHEALILDFLEESKNPRRKARLKKELLKLGIRETELLQYEQVYRDLGTLPVPAPGPSAQEGFYAMLEQHKNQTHVRESRFSNLKNLFEFQYLPRLAYSLLLIMAGWAAGFWSAGNDESSAQIEYLSTEVRQMKKIITLSMLNQASSAERIKKVNAIAGYSQGDNQIIQALISTLNSDPSINVRLSAVEALYKISDDNRVRTGLIHALDKQESPLVQLALIECYVALDEKQAVGHLRKLLNDVETNDVVKSQIEQSLKILI
jgi:hypothetical protein